MGMKLGRIVDLQRVTDASRVLPLQLRKMDPCGYCAAGAENSWHFR
jgi:hypothetical protein